MKTTPWLSGVLPPAPDRGQAEVPHKMSFQQALLAPQPTLFRAVIVTTVALALSTAMKFALDGWPTNVPTFLTYFPAVTLTALMVGPRWGAAALLTSAVLCDFFFMDPRFSWSLTLNDFVVLSLFAVGGGLIIMTADGLRRSAQELRAAAAREHELNAELKHRVNNNLAAVQGMARQIMRSRPTVDAFYQSFSSRLEALREAHAVLSSTDWAACDLPRLAERSLKGFHPDPAISLSGPAATLPSGSCVPLTLALHELATNALMHGALSRPDGRVSIGWRVDGNRLVLDWTETGGPPVATPDIRGLGARLLAPQPGLDEVKVDYLSTGVQATIIIAGARLS